MNIQWYPGHMTKAKRQMMDDIKLIDLVIELLDARIPFSSRNPDIDEIAGNRARLILLNKADMADESCTSQWKDYFEGKGLHVCVINSLNRSTLKQIDGYVRKACAEKIERDRSRGIKNRPVRAMVVGIPNVGKSTFINSFSGKASAKTGNKPGVTKGKQWIKLSNTLELLDTPGILWPKFDDQSVGLKLALIGSVKDEILNTEELALELIHMLEERYPQSLENFYGIADTRTDTDKNKAPSETISETFADDRREYGFETLPPVQTLEQIAAARGCIAKGGQTDYLRAANMVLDNFRNGKIGKFTLEKPEE